MRDKSNPLDIYRNEVLIEMFRFCRRDMLELDLRAVNGLAICVRQQDRVFTHSAATDGTSFLSYFILPIKCYFNILERAFYISHVLTF